jgi:hypothetical protein
MWRRWAVQLFSSNRSVLRSYFALYFCSYSYSYFSLPTSNF